jgi:hypothetical protein
VIEQILEVLSSIDRRLESIEQVMPFLCEKVSRVEGVVARPDGYVTFSGVANTTRGEIQAALNRGAVMNMESVQMDVRFTQAVYMGIRLSKNPELAEALSDGAVQQLYNILGEAEKALLLLDQVGKKEKEANELLTRAWEKLNTGIEADVRLHVKRSVDMIISEIAQESCKALDDIKNASEKAAFERLKVEKAMAGLIGAMEIANRSKESIKREIRDGVQSTIKDFETEFKSSVQNDVLTGVESIEKALSEADLARNGLEAIIADAKTTRAEVRQEVRSSRGSRSVTSMRV